MKDGNVALICFRPCYEDKKLSAKIVSIVVFSGPTKNAPYIAYCATSNGKLQTASPHHDVKHPTLFQLPKPNSAYSEETQQALKTVLVFRVWE